ITLAFGAKKPCHLLYPARAYCGDVHLMDVRIADAAILAQQPQTFENGPALWGGIFPQARFDQHKYSRGAVAIVAGPPLATGAARLAARASLRVGAGAVTLFAEPRAAAECAAHSTSVMVRAIEAPSSFADALAGARLKSVVVGPGGGVGEWTKSQVSVVAQSAAAGVYDADALTSF
ncbi:MAG: NAD(P)H-hydrate dehydratase, partial [Pseudomonadota bacterium]